MCLKIRWREDRADRILQQCDIGNTAHQPLGGTDEEGRRRIRGREHRRQEAAHDLHGFPAETFKKRVRTWFNGKAAKKVKKAFKDSHNEALEQATAPEATAREGAQAGFRL